MIHGRDDRTYLYYENRVPEFMSITVFVKLIIDYLG